MQKEDTILWKTSLIVNDYMVPLNSFVQTYIGNIMRAIINSLGEDGIEFGIYIEGEDLKVYTEKGDVPLEMDFAKAIVTATIKGVLSPLKGIFWLQRISINSKKEVLYLPKSDEG